MAMEHDETVAWRSRYSGPYIDEFKRTPLLSAAAARHVEAVQLLLNANGMKRAFKAGDALSLAIKNGHKVIVKLLQPNSN